MIKQGEEIKLGFVDYFLSEWHANNYPAWIKQNCDKTGLKARVAYAYADCDAPDGVTTDEWCNKNNVIKCDSIARVVELSDAIVVLAPNNPEQHMRLADLPLKSGKPLFIDKTFAPDSKTAKKLIELAVKYKTPMYSASSLRFASELKQFEGADIKSVVVIGGGSDFDVYIIHIAEIMVALMGQNAKRVMATCSGKNNSFTVDYGEGRTACGVVILDDTTPYTIAVETATQTKYIPLGWDFFVSSTGAMLEFISSGVEPVPHADTLLVAKLIEAAARAVKNLGEWQKII